MVSLPRRFLKEAFYKLVAKHSPEKDPEQYKLLRGAFDTLKDEKSRANYDAL